MFGGIVETTGSILAINAHEGCKRFTISFHKTFADLSIGDSISVNGVCLTITEFTEHTFNVTAVPETLRLTNLDQLSVGSPVNLERSLPSSARIGGHYVQGRRWVGQILEMKMIIAMHYVKISINTLSNTWLIKDMLD